MLKYNKLMKTVKNGNNSTKSPWDGFCQVSKLQPSDQKSQLVHLTISATSKCECSKRKCTDNYIHSGFPCVENKDCPYTQYIISGKVLMCNSTMLYLLSCHLTQNTNTVQINHWLICSFGAKHENPKFQVKKATVICWIWKHTVKFQSALQYIFSHQQT